ncbi:MAG: lysine transporter LysE [Geminicoccus sp.]|nr:lysine transporter LysE [Geminicoccus sp.]
MLSFTLAVFFLIITPGPAVLTAAGFGASYGFRRSISYVVGLLVGANLIMLLVITGLSAVVLSAPWLRFVLVAASLLFLLYLASKIAFAGTKIAFVQSERPPGFWSGVLIQTVNPKAYAVMTSLFTGFNYAPDAFLFEIITKILIANAFWLPIHLLWLWAGVQLHALNLSARAQRGINFAMAGALLIVVVLSGSSLLLPPA